MISKTIEKPRREWRVVPNLLDYEKVCAEFSWDAARRELDGLPGGRGLNIAHEAIDRHATGALRDHLALRWIGKRGETRDFSYGELRTLTNRFANVLRRLGLAKGERVFLLAGRVPELYISALGTLKNGNVFCPLFSAFGPEPIRQRIGIGDGRVLVTTPMLYKRKVADQRASLPGLKHVLLIGPPDEIRAIPNTVDFRQLMNEAGEDFEIPPTDPEDMALLHFTSGTTGMPKGAIHVHNAVVDALHDRQVRARSASGRHFLVHGRPGLGDRNVVWDHRAAASRRDQHHRRRRFRCRALVRRVETQKVTVWYTAPTAIRMLMRDAWRAADRIRPQSSASDRQRGRAAESRRPSSGASRLWACRSTTIGGRQKPAAS